MHVYIYMALLNLVPMVVDILSILSSSPDYPYFQEDTHANISWEGLCLSNNTQVCLSMEVCLNHSGPPEECFWNPKSRISGIFCEECEKLCRSWRTSLNFVQLIFGLLLFTLAFPITRISMTVLASDGMGSEGQVSLLHVGEISMWCAMEGGGGG